MKHTHLIRCVKVYPKPTTQKECLDELQHLLEERFAKKSGIIYTTSVKDCDQLASELRKRKLKVASYHANLEPARRSQVHQRWLSNEYQVCCSGSSYVTVSDLLLR